MSLTTRAGLLAGAAALTLTGVGAASATTDANTDQLRAQVEQLQQRIAELESRQGDNWLTERRAAEIRSLVHDVLADADTRASLLGSGLQAGYDGGFQIGDTAGNFLLQINGQLQTRFVYNYQRERVDQTVVNNGFSLFGDVPGDIADFLGFDPDDPAAGNFEGDRHRSGFELARTKLWFTGHVLNPDWRYHVEADFGRNGRFLLRDAWISHQYGDTGLIVTVGQFKLPFLREQLVDARYLQAVERSLVHQYFTAGRSQGIQVGWHGEMFRAFGAFSEGMHQDNTGWFAGPSPLEGGSTEYSLTGRVEVLLGGLWDDFNEFRSEPGQPFGLLVGGAVHFQDGEYGTGFPSETEVLGLTADAHLKLGGINLFGAYIFNHVDVSGAGNFTNHAWLIQGGVHLMPAWELFGRFEAVHWDSEFDIDDLYIVTVGVNHYMFGGGAGGHSAKWTTDFGYAIDRVLIGDVRTGWRADDPDGRRGQLVVRSQIQLAF